MITKSRKIDDNVKYKKKSLHEMYKSGIAQ